MEPKTTYRGEARGFSLLELMVALTLAVILTAAVVPIYHGSLRSTRIDHAVRDFLAVLRYAQERAVLDCIEHRVEMDDTSDTYWVARRVPTEDGENAFEEVTEVRGLRATLPQGLDLMRPEARWDADRGVYYVGFYASGACDVATVPLDRKNGAQIEIKTGGNLGRFEVTGL